MDEDTRAAAIEADYERWRVWLSDTGKWWAARKEALTADELSASAVPFLQADDPDELRQKAERGRYRPTAPDGGGLVTAT